MVVLIDTNILIDFFARSKREAFAPAAKKVMKLVGTSLVRRRDREKIAEMLRDGHTPEEIAAFCKYPIELVREVEESMLVAE